MATEYLKTLEHFTLVRSKFHIFSSKYFTRDEFRVIPYHFQTWSADGRVVTMQIRQGYKPSRYNSLQDATLVYTKLHSTIQHQGDTKQLIPLPLNPKFE